MEFEIKINIDGLPDALQVVPVEEAGEEKKYKIYNDQDYLGMVWPECIEEGLCWFSSDEIAEDKVIKIGEAIEKTHY